MPRSRASLPACAGRRSTVTFSGGSASPSRSASDSLSSARETPAASTPLAHASTPARSAPGISARSSGASAPRRSGSGRSWRGASARTTTAEVELARLDAESDEARRRLEAAGDVEPADGRRPGRARRSRRAPRGAPDRARPGEPARARGVRGRARAARRPEGAARGPRAEPRGARAPPGRARRHGRAAVRRDVRLGRRALRGGRRDPLPRTARAASGSSRPTRTARSRASRSSCGPPGKRITRLSLLSGGEKALGAISFLFSLFLARPCAFYLLDEVEAALDDTNIARFVELLRRYADRAVRRRHAPEADDGGRGRPLRGDDGARRCLAGRLAAAPAARPHAALRNLPPA